MSVIGKSRENGSQSLRLAPSGDEWAGKGGVARSFQFSSDALGQLVDRHEILDGGNAEFDGLGQEAGVGVDDVA